MLEALKSLFIHAPSGTFINGLTSAITLLEKECLQDGNMHNAMIDLAIAYLQAHKKVAAPPATNTSGNQNG